MSVLHSGDERVHTTGSLWNDLSRWISRKKKSFAYPQMFLCTKPLHSFWVLKAARKDNSCVIVHYLKLFPSPLCFLISYEDLEVFLGNDSVRHLHKWKQVFLFNYFYKSFVSGAEPLISGKTRGHTGRAWPCLLLQVKRQGQGQRASALAMGVMSHSLRCHLRRRALWWAL